MAIERGDHETVQLLLEGGADLNRQDRVRVVYISCCVYTVAAILMYRYTVWCCTVQVHCMVLYCTGTLYGAVLYRYTVWCCTVQVHCMVLYSTGTLYGAVRISYITARRDVAGL